VDDFVTAFDGGEDGIPFALDVGAVGVEVGVETGLLKDPFAGRYVFG